MTLVPERLKKMCASLNTGFSSDEESNKNKEATNGDDEVPEVEQSSTPYIYL